MKKIATIMICLLLVCMAAIPALAAGETVLSVTASGTNVYRGDQIEVVVSVSGSNPYMGMGIALSYDTSKFAFVSGSAKLSESVKGTMFEFDETATGGKMVLAFRDATAYAGELMRFKLTVKADSGFGESEITVTGTVNGASYVVKAAKVTVACKHSYDSYTKKDDNKHTATCTICNQPIEADHTWDEGKITTKTGCETPGEKTFTCTAKGCGATKVEKVKVTGHAWDNDCDTECNNGCGTTREITHKYSDKYTSDAKGHWYACTVCGDKHDYYEHTPDRDAPTEKEAQLCKYCGYVIADKLPHEHDISGQMEKDENEHWYYCSKVGCYMRIDLAAHVYDNECDIDCNVCGYIRIPPHQFKPEWRGSQEGHWQVCALCNAESEILPHTPGEPATDENPQLCTDCHYWLQWPLSHEHTFGDAWEHDEDGHWQICEECLGNSESQAHTWDEGTVILQPTETEEGIKKYVCTVCGQEKQEHIPAETVPGGDPTEPTRPQVPGVPGDDGGFPWWIIGASAVVLLIVGIVLLVIEFIRSRKTNMHGKFSK